MLKCWNYAPENRPTFRYCLEVLLDLHEQTDDEINITMLYTSWQTNGMNIFFYCARSLEQS